MYFFAIDTTSRRLAEVSCSRASRPMTTIVALAVAQLRVERHLRVVAHPLEQVGVVAGEDPALERRERDVLAGPVPDRPQPDVVARVEVAVVDGEERPVEQRQERLRRRASRCRCATSFLASLRRSFVPSDWASRPALTRWKSGDGDEQVLRALVRDRVADQRRAPPRRTAGGAAAWSSASCARCRGASTRGARRSPFHGASTICSPSSIALARTTSSSAVSRATLPISLRYIRTGSSIPIMSAEIASSSSADGSSTSFGSSLAGASAGSLAAGSAAPSSVTTTSIADVGAVLGGRLRAEVEIVVVVIVIVVAGHGDAGLGGATGAGRRAWPLRGPPWRDGAATGRPPRVACLGDRRTWCLLRVVRCRWRTQAGSGLGAGRATGALR